MDRITSKPITIDIPTALKLTSLSRSFLYELLADGSIRSHKAGKRRLVSYASLKDYMTNLPSGSLTPKKEF